MALADLARGLRHLGLVADVAGERFRLDLLQRLLEGLLAAPGNHHLRTMLRQPRGARQTEAATGSGHDGHLAAEVE